MGHVKNKTSNKIDRFVDVVDKAGKILLGRFYKRNHNHIKGTDLGFVKEKSKKELVIEEDLLSEKMIIDQITKLEPDAVIYSEEKNNINLLKNDNIDNSVMKYILDPLDGTHNFYYGLPYWGIALALVDEFNKSIAGLINIPCLNIFLRNDGNGFPTMLKQGEHWHEVKTTNRILEKALISYDNQFYKLGHQAIEIYDILTQDAFTTRITGSAATDTALIAAGRINSRIWNKTISYDIAAGIPIVLGAGGCVSDFQGNPISILASKVIMSSENDLHDRLIKEISSI